MWICSNVSQVITICQSTKKQQIHHPFLDASALLHNTHPAAVKQSPLNLSNLKNSDTFLKTFKKTITTMQKQSASINNRNKPNMQTHWSCCDSYEFFNINKLSWLCVRVPFPRLVWFQPPTWTPSQQGPPRLSKNHLPQLTQTHNTLRWPLSPHPPCHLHTNIDT